MASRLVVTFERDGERLVLSLVGPNAMVENYVVWRDWFTEGKHEARIIKMMMSERRVIKFFNRHCDKMIKAGWTEL